MIKSLFALGASYFNKDDYAVNQIFLQYVNQFGKNYGTKEEYQFRFDLFKKKDKLINEWNSRDGVTHTLAHNVFSDKTDDEIRRALGYVVR